MGNGNGIAVIYRTVKEGLANVGVLGRVQQKEKGKACIYLGRSILMRGKSKCQSLEMRACLLSVFKEQQGGLFGQHREKGGFWWVTKADWYQGGIDHVRLSR